MNAKRPLIITDADVVIDLHSLGVWDRFVDSYHVHLAQTVVEEAGFYPKSKMRFSSSPDDVYVANENIDLSEDIKSERITVLDLDAKDMIPLQNEAEKMGVREAIHSGEEETLAAVYHTHTQLTACLIDEGAIRCAVMVDLADKCISVEKALQQCGLGRNVSDRLSDSRFQRIVKHAEQERVQKLQL